MSGGRYRLRVEYPKGERLAFLGHLEVIGTVGRCVRRAELPFRVGNGFARRMTVQFSQALPVGASSSCEYYDLTLTERVDPKRALDRLRSFTPPPLAPTRAAYVDLSLPALEVWLDRSSWLVEPLGCEVSAPQVEAAVARLVEGGTLTFMRGDRERSLDLCTTLVSLSCEDREGRGPLMRLETRMGEGGALRPAALLAAALGQGAYRALRVRRVAQCHQSEDGSLVEAL